MYTILVRNYIETGFSLDDAAQLENSIDTALKTTEGKGKIIIDFAGVKFFTTQFFNNSIGKYVLQLSPDGFNDRFEIINLSEVGQATFQHSYDNAVSYFNLPPDKRLEQDKIVDQAEDI